MYLHKMFARTASVVLWMHLRIRSHSTVANVIAKQAQKGVEKKTFLKSSQKRSKQFSYCCMEWMCDSEQETGFFSSSMK